MSNNGIVYRNGIPYNTIDPYNDRTCPVCTHNYDEWIQAQDFSRAQREGRVQYVVHIHTGTVQHKHMHTHIHYNGGRLPEPEA